MSARMGMKEEMTMAKYIGREVAIAKLTDLEVIEPNVTIADVKRLLADMPGAKAVSLRDIYRVIAGHSYYHGDGILAALTCITEGIEVNPVRPADVAPVVHARWIYVEETLATSSGYCCSACRRPRWLSPDVPEVFKYCPNCGAMMDGGIVNGR